MAASRNNLGISVAVSAPGKVILHGEHSVVYKKLAIATSINLRTYASFTEVIPEENEPKRCSIVFKTFNQTYIIDFESFKNKLLSQLAASGPLQPDPDVFSIEKVRVLIENFTRNEILKENEDGKSLLVVLLLYCLILAPINYPHAPFDIVIRSDINPGAGTGSSASFSVSVAAMYIQLLKKKKTSLPSDIWEADIGLGDNLEGFNDEELRLINRYAYLGECILHGKPSGIDNTVCTYGSIVEFRIGEAPVLTKQALSNLKILIINTKIERNTKALVQRVADMRSNHREIIDGIMDVLDKVARDAVTDVNTILKISSDSEANSELKSIYCHLQDLVDINQNLLRSLGVSHPRLEELIGILADFSLHGKLTGAGGGGNAICYVPPYVKTERIEKVISILRNKGFEPLFVNMGEPGVRVESKF